MAQQRCMPFLRTHVVHACSAMLFTPIHILFREAYYVVRRVFAHTRMIDILATLTEFQARNRRYFPSCAQAC
jgi:hypothetical protein